MDLEELCEKIKNREITLRQAAKDSPGLYKRYKYGLRRLFSIQDKYVVRENIVSIWIHGKPGSGKTRLARELGGDDAFYQQRWNSWSDYLQEDVVVIDNYRDRPGKVFSLTRYLDWPPVRLPGRCGVQLHATKIIITCMHPPDVALARAHEHDRNKIMRLLTKIVNVENGETFAWADLAPTQNNNTHTDSSP